MKGRPVMVAKFSQQEFWHPEAEIRIQRRPASPLCLFRGAVPGRRHRDPAGLRDEDAFLLGTQMKKPPVVLLLADEGYQNYATAVFGLKPLLDKKPEAVRAFVEATRAGFEACMAGDYAAGMKLMLAMNPDHGEPLFHFKLKEMKDRGLVDGGDAKTLGIGANDDARWKEFSTPCPPPACTLPADYKAPIR